MIDWLSRNRPDINGDEMSRKLLLDLLKAIKKESQDTYEPFAVGL